MPAPPAQVLLSPTNPPRCMLVIALYWYNGLYAALRISLCYCLCLWHMWWNWCCIYSIFKFTLFGQLELNATQSICLFVSFFNCGSVVGLSVVRLFNCSEIFLCLRTKICTLSAKTDDGFHHQNMEPDGSASTCFICSCRYVWSLSNSEGFPWDLACVWPLTTVYLIMGFYTITDSGAPLAQILKVTFHSVDWS